jgi:hypothetical protein
MYTEGFDQWIKMNKSFAVPLSEMSKVTSDICKRISEQNLDIINKNLSRLSTQLKRFGNIKEADDIINIQKDCLSENIAANIETMQNLFRLSISSMEEISNIWNITTKMSDKMSEKTSKKNP